MLRTIFEAECSLSPTEGILGKEQPLEVLKTSALNHIPTGWCVYTVCVCVSVCLRLWLLLYSKASERAFTINCLLCDFASVL